MSLTFGEIIKSLVPSVSAPAAFHSHLETPLLRLWGFDDFRLRDACEGTQIFGGTGSGKSSGSGKALALSYLCAGFGGLVLCAKPDEADRWLGYAKLAGRLPHVLRLTPDGFRCFNFLLYELMRPDGAGWQTFNLVNLFMRIIEASQLSESASGGGDNPFWGRALREQLGNILEPLFAATGTLALDDVMRFITSAPQSRAEAQNDEWKARSFCYAILRKAFEAPVGRRLSEQEMRTSTDYWFRTYADLDPKTRSNLQATLTSTISPFLRGMLREKFCTHTDIVPELTHEGAIIIVDFPVKIWGDAAVVAANILKYQWQRATERRTVHGKTRPVFLWADECQFFLSDYDAEFQSTARSSLAATVYITQNLPTYYSRLRVRDPRAAAESLLGNFQTKIFHANTDPTTNEFAANMIGKSLQQRFSRNWGQNRGYQDNEGGSTNWGRQRGSNEGRNWGSSSGGGSSFGTSHSSTGDSWNSTYSSNHGSSVGRSEGTSRSNSWGGGESWGTSRSEGHSDGASWSEQMDFTIQPAVFAARLRKGGHTDGGLVDGIVVQGGRHFQTTGAHWLACTFRQ